MIIVHHLNLSRSHRIIWLLEELNLQYEIITYQRQPKFLYAPEAMKNIHPIGKSPIITDGTLVLAESGAIIEYLLYRYGNGQLKPAAGTPEWIQYLFWLHFAEGSLMPLQLLKLVFERVVAASPLFIKPIAKNIKKMVGKNFYEPRITAQLNYIESQLADSLWLTGNEFSAADIQMGVSIMMHDLQDSPDKNRPILQEYIARILVRPAFVRTIERAGPISR